MFLLSRVQTNSLPGMALAFILWKVSSANLYKFTVIRKCLTYYRRLRSTSSFMQLLLWVPLLSCKPYNPQCRKNMTETRVCKYYCNVLFIFPTYRIEFVECLVIADYGKSRELEEFTSNLKAMFNQATFTSEETQLLWLFKYHEARSIIALAHCVNYL